MSYFSFLWIVLPHDLPAEGEGRKDANTCSGVVLFRFSAACTSTSSSSWNAIWLCQKKHTTTCWNRHCFLQNARPGYPICNKVLKLTYDQGFQLMWAKLVYLAVWWSNDEAAKPPTSKLCAVLHQHCEWNLASSFRVGLWCVPARCAKIRGAQARIFILGGLSRSEWGWQIEFHLAEGSCLLRKGRSWR